MNHMLRVPTGPGGPADRRSRWAWAAVAGWAALALATTDAAATGRVATPVVSCVGSEAAQASLTLEVCAGTTGTPAGFVLKWLELPNGAAWPPTNEDACFSYFWSKGRGYLLKPGQCIEVSIGEMLATEASRTSCAEVLTCGTSYGFRSYGRESTKLKRGAVSSAVYCSTLPCTPGDTCTLTQGYWDTHGPTPKGNNDYTWPQSAKDDGLYLGTILYLPDALLAILRKPVGGNGLIQLAHQLIAAKLNVANGADPTDVAAAIEDADDLIGVLHIPPGGTGSLSTDATSELTDLLADYNEGAIGPGHCGR
jgi:hypothetical protein